uniref:Large ribosomal subunit protein uL13c n=1 Tax=Pteridomonas danica TaxID=38822 RepID=A0A7T1FUR6_9STRA|nr:ribosomal protein L13 [Pteridomonas danica]QPM99295.1 ribosomal protein L13 [Pteridomonas danica]
MNTTFFESKNFFLQKWYIINAKNKVIGRLASQISQILLSKNNVLYTPFLLSKNHIIIINSKEIIISGKKVLKKKYFKYSGYPGGQKFNTFLDLKKQNPEKLIRHAVAGMLPKNILGRHSFLNLYVYSSKTHSHVSQFPKYLFL